MAHTNTSIYFLVPDTAIGSMALHPEHHRGPPSYGYVFSDYSF